MEHQHPVLHALDELIASRSILQHPFYRAWREGRLTQQQLLHTPGFTIHTLQLSPAICCPLCSTPAMLWCAASWK